MKISTKGRYALRIMLDIAIHEGNDPVSLKEVAGRQNISEKYMEQIIATLNKAGLVKSIRGPQGGYYLSKKPEEYTVGAILRTTEGSLTPVTCLDKDSPLCEKANDCVTVYIYKKLYDAINGVVDGITLADMMAWQAEKGNDYVI